MSGHLCKLNAVLGRRAAVVGISVRTLSSSNCLCGRKTREPFDKRFPIFAKDLNKYKVGGNREICKALTITGPMAPQQPGYYDKSGEFVFVPEMVPEFIVPDLTEFTAIEYNLLLQKSREFVFMREMVPEFIVPDLTEFTLKPYVSYKVTNITQSEFTARNLFDAVYGKKIVEDFQDGKLQEGNAIENYTKLDSG